MEYFRVSTPTELDIREIITLGLTSKANAGKIGHKGTGLKFALAFLHRLKSHLAVRSAGYHLMSQTQTVPVKGNDHEVIQLKSLISDQIWEANMTTHAGSDTWTQPWFILRELLQNAIDENGSYEITDSPELPQTTGTILQVLLTPELLEAWQNREEWFQPRYPGIFGKGHPTTKGLYFHGFLVYSASDAWRNSYDVTNFLSREQLSEDRQLRNVDLHTLFVKIVEVANFASAAPGVYDEVFSEQPKDDIRLIFEAVYQILGPETKSWGGDHGFKMGQLEEAFHKRFGPKAAFHAQPLNSNDAQAYYARAAGYTPVQVPYQASKILNGYSSVKKLSDCLPEIHQRLRKVKQVDISRFGKLKIAMKIARRIQPPGVKVEVVAKLVADDTIHCSALADPANHRIMVLEDLLDRDVSDIARVLIEEYAHIKTGAGDMSREMQNSLTETIYQLLVRNRKARVDNLQTSEALPAGA